MSNSLVARYRLSRIKRLEKEKTQFRRWVKKHLRAAENLSKIYLEDGARFMATRQEGRAEAFRAVLEFVDDRDDVYD